MNLKLNTSVDVDVEGFGRIHIQNYDGRPCLMLPCGSIEVDVDETTDENGTENTDIHLRRFAGPREWAKDVLTLTPWPSDDIASDVWHEVFWCRQAGARSGSFVFGGVEYHYGAEFRIGLI